MVPSPLQYLPLISHIHMPSQAPSSMVPTLIEQYPNRRRTENHLPDPCWKKGSFGAVSIQPITCACCLGKRAAALGGLWLVCGVRSYKGSWVRNPYSPCSLFSTHLFRKLKQKLQKYNSERQRKKEKEEEEVGVPLPCFCSNCQQSHAL